MKVGSVVYSKMGRDQGRCYMLIAQDDKEGYWLVADGEIRTIAHPKRKNGRHLVYNGEDLEVLAVKIAEGKQIFDSELRSALRSYGKEGR